MTKWSHLYGGLYPDHHDADAGLFPTLDDSMGDGIEDDLDDLDDLDDAVPLRDLLDEIDDQEPNEDEDD